MTSETSAPSAAHSETILIDRPDGPMPAHLWRPVGGRGPGIVVFQEIFGVSGYIRARCADLAGLGYVVLAPEIYWRLGGYSFEGGPDVIERAMGFAGQVDWELAVGDGKAALEELQQHPDVIGGAGVLGFCFGGGLAYNVAAVGDPSVLVSYYGSSLPQLLGLTEQVDAPSLHHFGLDDDYIPIDTVRSIEAAVVRGSEDRFETYAGAGHAFDNPLPMVHHAEASAAAWETTKAYLSEHLPLTS